MARTPRQKDIDVVGKNLDYVAKKIEEIQEFLDKNPWSTEEDPEKQEKKFKTSIEMMKSMTTLRRDLMEDSGIMEIFKRHEEDNKVRKNSQKSGIQHFINKKTFKPH